MFTIDDLILSELIETMAENGKKIGKLLAEYDGKTYELVIREVGWKDARD